MAFVWTCLCPRPRIFSRGIFGPTNFHRVRVLAPRHSPATFQSFSKSDAFIIRAPLFGCGQGSKASPKSGLQQHPFHQVFLHSLILLPAVLWYFPLEHHQVSPLADASACASLEVRAQTEVRRTGVCARTLREVHVTYDISCFINDPICFVLPAQSARTRHELRCRYRRRMWLAHRPLHRAKLAPAPIRRIGDTCRTRTKIP